ncbi:MAG: hypothetical protein J6U66_00585, partial [Lachnospiraceae bacterium]|nr:hypothetical protein [Lachnospiraceae bacterium]
MIKVLPDISKNFIRLYLFMLITSCDNILFGYWHMLTHALENCQEIFLRASGDGSFWHILPGVAK